MKTPKDIGVLFVAGFGPIVRDADASRKFYAKALGLPFKEESNGYVQRTISKRTVGRLSSLHCPARVSHFILQRSALSPDFPCHTPPSPLPSPVSPRPCHLPSSPPSAVGAVSL
jgi:hypothetical protein